MHKSIEILTLLVLLFSNQITLAVNNDAKASYELGHAAMMSKDWNDAIEAFEQAANERELRAASQYWQAYSHYKIKQKAQAKRLLERLIKNQPDSDWVDDAQVLLFEHGDGDETTSHQAALDEELKLFTLQQMMFNNPDKALPKIKAILKESESVRVKQSAIQLMGLSDSEQVSDYLFSFIETEKNQELQHQAIQMLSLRDSQKSREKLKKLYDNSQDKEIKSAIIQGFIHHDDNDELMAMLKKETDPELNQYLIQMLGIKGETAALKDLYKGAKGDSKRAIMEALALSGDARYLYDVIDNETDQEIRNQAIHSLIMVDDDNMGDYLAKLYKKANNDSEKDVISNVFIATDVDAEIIVEILKSESSQDRKVQLINTLMSMGEVSALQSVYEDETDGEIKSEIIRHLGIMDATDVLMNMYKDDPSLVNNNAFFEAFGMSSTELDDDFLMARFKEGNREVKNGVLNALMVQDNSDVMVKLLKTEKDHEIKKMIIQMIGMTNPDALIDAIED
jgi:outer membrane protein assembly factor BamD (BamD/ComL family)